MNGQEVDDDEPLVLEDETSNEQDKDTEGELVLNPKYVPGIVEPSERQLNNWLNNTYRPQLNGGSKFNYVDLAIWIEKNEEIPEDNPEFEHIPSYIIL